MSEAHIEDAQALTDLTFRSKAYWGYSVDQMELWRDDLLIAPDYIIENHVFTLRASDQLVGYYSYFPIVDQVVKLDNLFVEPGHINQGFGRLLLFDFIARMQKQGVHKIKLDADPHATAFYQKYGFDIIGQKQSTIPGRFLPEMEIDMANSISG